MEHSYWEIFKQTGRVEDYLYYKGIEICSKMAQKYEGGVKIESDDNNYRDGIVSIAGRGV